VVEGWRWSKVGGGRRLEVVEGWRWSKVGGGRRLEVVKVKVKRVEG
jgi:hypothetical protein